MPVRLIFPVAEREDEARDRRHPRAVGQTADTCRCARSRTIEKATGRAAINREANSRVLALKFNVEGRDMGSVVNDAHRGRQARRQGARGQLLRVGRRVREPERALARLARDRAVLVPGRVRAALHGARIDRAARSRCSLVAPLAMSGGVFGLAVTRIPLSVSAAVGFIALLGQVCLASLLVVSADRRATPRGRAARDGPRRGRRRAVPRGADGGAARDSRA